METNNLDNIAKSITSSVLLSGVAAAALLPHMRQTINAAIDKEEKDCCLELRLENDRKQFGITESEQVALLKAGMYEWLMDMLVYKD